MDPVWKDGIKTMLRAAKSMSSVAKTPGERKIVLRLIETIVAAELEAF